MTELLCIQTHSEGVVVAGSTYTLLRIRKNPCNCSGVKFDVGIISPKSHTRKQRGITGLRCTNCSATWALRDDDNTWWLSPELFAQIGTEDECEQYREKVLIEK